MFVEIDSKTSRAILKSISYGLPYDPVGLHRDSNAISNRLSELRHRYNGMRIGRGKIDAPVSNYLFYLMLKEKYSEFSFELRHSKKQVLTNLHKFKTGGRIPSLAALLLSDSIGTKTDIELKYESVLNSSFKAQIATLLSDSDIMAPAPNSMKKLIETLDHCKDRNEQLTLVSAICPDYAYIRDATGRPHYTFNSVGHGTGLAGDKLIKAGYAIKTFASESSLRVNHMLYGGEFEYNSFYKGQCTEVERADFLSKVETQLVTVGAKLQTDFQTVSFFQRCGGEEEWVNQHAVISARIRAGDYGETGLDKFSMQEIYESRLPLYSKWFPNAPEEKIWNNFTSQAAEYALMGKLFHEHHGRHVVVAVDHYRMEPFYSYFHPSSVLYIKTDYV
ncbi:hypothetical protein OKW98_09460 [Pseudomonas sp. KU26590]|uniref:hypothetical protein n=1 Tax=Pseudomonas sp. KU26590 TaxID=2991051 RepID=UPI00223CFA49|nr:hypothetical protein [Pseudomonas sp. KU26590]UZJ61911.1 hypothetical protein OKW98_09460 [Pseudomonas sp. KU26590]